MCAWWYEEEVWVWALVTVFVGKGKPGGWAEKVLHNKSGKCGRETIQSHRQPTPQACYRNCGIKRRLRMGMGRRMDMGRAWG